MRDRVLVMPSPVSSGSVGSVTKCVGIAKLLREQGVRTLFAVGGQLGRLAADAGFEVADCPLPQFSGNVQHVTNIVDFLRWTGLADPAYVARTVDRELEIIAEFRPGAVFAEARPTAALSAAITGVPLATIASWPMHPEFGANAVAGDQLCEVFNPVLERHGLPALSHVAELLFPRSQLRLSPSLPDLEPELAGITDVEFTGHMLDSEVDHRLTPPWFQEWNTRPLVLVYLSVGAIEPRIYLQSLPEAFTGSPFNVLCLCGYHFGLDKLDLGNSGGNVRFANYVPTQNVIDSCVAVVFHGGQDTMLATLRNGLPSITFPGKHFEREYNSRQLEKLGASRVAPVYDFRGSRLRTLLDNVVEGPEAARSRELAETLSAYGGTARAAELLRGLAAHGRT